MSAVPDSVRASLAGLRMPCALEALDHTVRRLETGGTGALEAIGRLLGEESALRDSRRVDIALKTPRLTPAKTLESFGFSFQPSLGRDRIAALARPGFVERAGTVHFLGPPGAGKSHPATAIGVAAVKAGRSFCSAAPAEIAAAPAKAGREGRLIGKLRFLARAAPLIVDGIGCLPIATGGASLFFQPVNARYEKGAMTLTPNRGFAERAGISGDPVVAAALLDRLLHHAAAVQIEGASHRLRQHAGLVPEHVRANASIMPPPPPRRRGRPGKEAAPRD